MKSRSIELRALDLRVKVHGDDTFVPIPPSVVSNSQLRWCRPLKKVKWWPMAATVVQHSLRCDGESKEFGHYDVDWELMRRAVAPDGYRVKYLDKLTPPTWQNGRVR